MLTRRILILALALLYLSTGAGSVARADEPLHVRIDALITARFDGPASARSTDAEFLRRVYLDLAGRIPSSAETREFLADADPQKRAKCIDRILASPDHPRRMTDFLNVMLMERLGDHADWKKYLAESCQANKPWDVMVREMIWADDANENARGAAYFFSKRLENYGQNPVDMPGLVRDVGRLFLGMDVQCAQCHDHLFVAEYTQDYFQGLYAFLGQTTLRRDVQYPAIAETPLKKKVEYASVFTKEPKSIGLKLPGGLEVAVPEFKAGEEYEMPPDRKTNFPGKLKFSPIKLLAEQLPTSANAPFARNMANRLWWMLMGRGLVHPLDLHHADNPPSHPELLELLGREFAAHQFDMRWLLRELAMTETYQRSSLAPEGVAPDSIGPATYRTALEKPLSSEQLLAAMLQATGVRPAADPQPAPEAANTANTAQPQEGEAKKSPTKEPAQMEKWREHFAKAFANPPREPEVEFSPSVKAALFVLNDQTVLGWLKPTGGNLVERLTAVNDVNALIDEAYLAVLSRPADDEERREATEYLARHAGESAEQRSRAIGHVVWALLSSNEFAVNH